LSKNWEKDSLNSVFEKYKDNLSKNIAYLKKTDPLLYKRLLNCEVEKYLENAQNGSLTMKIKNIYIESKYNPVKSSSRYICSNIKEDRFIIFIGSGMGYHINAFFKEKSFKGLVIENNLIIFKASCYVIEHEYFKNLIFLVGLNKEVLIKRIEGVPFQKSYVIKHKQSYLLNKVFYNNLESIIKKRIKENIASYVTERGFKRLWVGNIIKNLAQVNQRFYGTKGLFKVFRGPVILVASGPFIDDSIEKIKEYSKTIPVLSLLPSVRYLLSHKIRPDAVVSTDAGFGNRYRYLRDIDLPLISTYSVDTGLIKNWKGDIFLFSHGLPLEKISESIKDFSLEIPMQGTSSLVMLMLARMMGFTEIYLAGFDFAYKGIMDHHKGGGFDDHFNSISNRLKNWHTFLAERLKNDSILKIKDHFGEDICSSYKLILYRDWFEKRLLENDLYRLNNGANIKNIKTSFSKILGEHGYETKRDFNVKIEAMYRYKICKEIIYNDFIRINDYLISNLNVEKLEGLKEAYRIFFGKTHHDQKKEEIKKDVIHALNNFNRCLKSMENRHK